MATCQKCLETSSDVNPIVVNTVCETHNTVLCEYCSIGICDAKECHRFCFIQELYKTESAGPWWFCYHTGYSYHTGCYVPRNFFRKSTLRAVGYKVDIL